MSRSGTWPDPDMVGLSMATPLTWRPPKDLHDDRSRARARVLLCPGDILCFLHAVAKWLGTAHFVTKRPGRRPLGTHCATACMRPSSCCSGDWRRWTGTYSVVLLGCTLAGLFSELPGSCRERPTDTVNRSALLVDSGQIRAVSFRNRQVAPAVKMTSQATRFAVQVQSKAPWTRG